MNGIKIGQIWRDCHRLARKVRVVRISGDRVWLENVRTGRRTKAMPERFNGKSDGYVLLEDERFLV